MNRFLACFCIILAVYLTSVADGEDAVQKELEEAKATYQTEKEAHRVGVLQAFDKREDAARKLADKKLVDNIKAEREAFEKWNANPGNIPAAIVKRRMTSHSRMEAAYNSAIKSYVRTKNDEAAGAIEKELIAFRGEDWPHLELDSVKFTGDAFRIGSQMLVSTKAEYSGPIEINVIARTEKNDIRLDANRGSTIIFNWADNHKELRVTRPDGQDRRESGSLATAPVTPLKTGAWYRLRWRLTNTGMEVFVNDQLVFTEKRNYDLTAKSKISVRTHNSDVEVRDFHVIPLTKD